MIEGNIGRGGILLILIIALSFFGCAKKEAERETAAVEEGYAEYEYEEVVPAEKMKEFEAPAADYADEGVVSGVEDVTIETSAGEVTEEDIGIEQIKVSRKVIKTGNVTIEVGSVDESLQELNKILGKYQADIENRVVVGAGKYQGMYAVTSVRIAPEHFEELVEDVKELGELKDENISAQDVTKQHVDLMARLKNARLVRERYQRMLDKAVTVGEMITIEHELERVSEKIEMLQAELDSLMDLESRSTLTIALQEPTSFFEPFAGFGQGMMETFRWVVQILIYSLRVLIILIPFVIIFIIVFLIIKLIIRLVRLLGKPRGKPTEKKGEV